MLIALVTGCASSTEIRGPQGQVRHQIECSGAANSMETCFKEAKSLCPNGYEVLDTKEVATPGFAGPYGGRPGVQRRLVVQCSG